MTNQEVKKKLDTIEEFGYIVKQNRKNVKIVEVYKSIISNRIIQNVIAETSHITTSEKWLDEVFEYLKINK